MKKYIAIMLVLSMLVPAAASVTAREWTLRIDAKAGDGHTYCLVGEKKDASDGIDQYDVPHPPFFPPGRAFIFCSEPSFPSPYENVWMEWKHYPGTQKEFNLTTFYYPNGNEGTLVTFSWSPLILRSSEYRHVYLTLNGVTLLDMMKSSIYTFWNDPWQFTQFKILCSRGFIGRV
jgi:hypothetical protein